jgi:UDP-GlcNAc:undecaprenyl-phosphate GlcNAc-1-phosphate transferase
MGLAFIFSGLLTALILHVSRRLGVFDSPGVPGQVKGERRPVPNTGGIAIVTAIVLPVFGGVLLLRDADPAAALWARLLPDSLAHELAAHIPGIVSQAPLAILLCTCLLWLHVLGLVDDRRPLGAGVKGIAMALPAIAVPLVTTLTGGHWETRLLTMVDAYVGGPWLSIVLTVVWFLAVTNAMNFMDNMDGLSAGTAAVAGSFFLVAAIVRPEPQWFVAATLALLVGAAGGFLFFNAPRPGGARIFMGDGGSLVIGFLLAFLTTRTTYIGPAAGRESPWYALLMPLVVLAVPLYDLVSVVTIRISQGRSPFVGDLQHLSHRLVARGLSRAWAVGIIWALTAITGFSGILLARADASEAIVIGIQVLLLLGVVAAVEYGARDNGKECP